MKSGAANFKLSLLAITAGVLLSLSFAPFEWYWFSVPCLASLLFIFMRASPWQAFFLGWIFGVGYFGASYSWLYSTLNRTESEHLLFIFSIILIAIFLCALLTGFLGYFLKKFFSKNNASLCLLAFPALWVIVEWMLGTIYPINGLPWLILGNSQINGPLSGFAPVFGTYGISYLIAFSSGVLVYCFTLREIKKIILPILLVFLLWTMGFLLITINWTTPASGWLKVIVVQKNDAPITKLENKYKDDVVLFTKQLIDTNPGVNLIIWPEGTFQSTTDEAQNYLNKIDVIAKKNNVAVIFGILHLKNNNLYNSMIALGGGRGIYLKRSLVPFSEYIPTPWLFSYLSFKMNLGFPNYAQGPQEQPPLIIMNDVNINSLICFEVIFQQLARDSNHANSIIITISNDYWISNSQAISQILQIKQMRALENGRYLITAVNHGISAIIDPKGKIIKFLPKSQTGILTGQIKAMKGNTPFGYWGNLPLGLLIFFSLLLSFSLVNIKTEYGK